MKKVISLVLSMLCITIFIYTSDVSKQNNTITRFNNLFFKKLSNSNNLCYAVVQTPNGNKAIRTVIEEPRWYYVEEFKNKDVEYIGSLGTDKIIVLKDGNIFTTNTINDTAEWKTKPIITNRTKDSVVLQIVGKSIDTFWLTLYKNVNKTTKVGLAIKDKASNKYTVNPTDSQAIAITPDSKYAWFIKPLTLSKDDHTLVVSIKELGENTKEKAQAKTTSRDNENDDDDSFEDAPTTLDETIFKNIKNIVAIDGNLAYILDHNGMLYSLDRNVAANKIDTSAVDGTIDAIAILDNKLIVTSGSTIYRYENKQFMPLLKKDIIETEENTISEKKPEPPLAAEKIEKEAPSEEPTVTVLPVSSADEKQIIAPETIVTKISQQEETTPLALPETQAPLPLLPLSEELPKPKVPPLQLPSQSKEKKPNSEPLKDSTKKNLDDKYVPELITPITTGVDFSKSPAPKFQDQIIPKTPTKPTTPQSSSYWDLLKKSAAVARVKAQGALQNYGQKASGWFKGWYTQK